jgi:diguanylate cyclase (GGDEF)-like protein/PAS domain S-box-containing protein
MGSRAVTRRRARRTPSKRPAGAPGLADPLVAAWPGPAARLAADGSILVANPAAAVLLDELKARSGDSGLAGLLAASLADRQPRTDTIVVPAKPAPLTFDLCVLPMANGSAPAEVVILARDVSLAANLRQALAESRQRFKDLVEISSDFAWETDAAGTFTFVSPKGALGWAATDLLGRPASSFVADAPAGAASPFTTRGRIDGAELWLRCADGTPACVSIAAVPLLGADGSWRGARGVWRDVTETHAREAALAEAENRERLVGYITRMVRDEVEPDAMLTAAASAVARALGAVGCRIWTCDADNVLSLAAEFGAAAPDGLEVEVPMAAHVRRLQLGADAPRPDRDDQLALTVPGGKFLGAVTRFRQRINGAIGLWRWPDAPDWSDSDHAVVSKIADQIGIAQEQIANQAALARQARTDALTGLLNRRGFAKRLDVRVAECARTGRVSSLVYVDLDNFKQVNDRLGHAAGDAALKGLADSLRRVVRADDLVARLGGDEFAVWLEGADEKTAIERAEEILALKEEIARYSAGPDVPLGLSVGVAVHVPAAHESTSELLSRADDAMYAVKRTGKGSYAVAPDIAAFRAARAKADAQAGP